MALPSSASTRSRRALGSSGVPAGPTSTIGDSSSRRDHTSRMRSVDDDDSTNRKGSNFRQSVLDKIAFFKQSSMEEEKEDQQAVSNVVMNYETKGQKKVSW